LEESTVDAAAGNVSSWPPAVASGHISGSAYRASQLPSCSARPGAGPASQHHLPQLAETASPRQSRAASAITQLWRRQSGALLTAFGVAHGIHQHHHQSAPAGLHPSR
jgi:hypothetical protein